MSRNLALALLGVVLLAACATPTLGDPATDLQQPVVVTMFRPPS